MVPVCDLVHETSSDCQKMLQESSKEPSVKLIIMKIWSRVTGSNLQEAMKAWMRAAEW